MFVLCTTGKRQLQRRGGKWRQPVTQATTGRSKAATTRRRRSRRRRVGRRRRRRRGLAGDPIKIFNKQCSTPRQEKIRIEMK